MPKTILSNNGYSIDKTAYPLSVLAKCRRDLTIEPFVDRPEFGVAPPPIKIYQETGKRMYMPRFYGQKEFGKPEVDKLTTNTAIEDRSDGLKMKDGFELFDYQVAIGNTMKEFIGENGGGVLSIPCGYGKTILGVWFASQLKIKTMIVCHTTDLMQQWKDEIEQWMPNVKIGILQQNKVQLEGNDIVIASLSSVAQKEFALGFFDSIGLVIWDEIHLMCTQLFSEAFPKLISKYTLGLSATPNRKDKCERIFQSFIGPIFCNIKRTKDPSVEVRCILFKFPVKIEQRRDWKGKDTLLYTTTLKNVCFGEERTNYLVQEIVELTHSGRKVLVLSEYVDHLKLIQKKLQANERFHDINKKTAGLYIGELKNKDRLVSRQCDAILGTYKMASVGMNIPTLDTIILASPRKDQNQLEQSIGRIFRKKTKFHKMVVDLTDDSNIFISQGRERKKFYKLYDYTIVQETRDETGKLLSKRSIHNVNKPDTKSKKKQKSIVSDVSNVSSDTDGSGGDDDQLAKGFLIENDE